MGPLRPPGWQPQQKTPRGLSPESANGEKALVASQGLSLFPGLNIGNVTRLDRSFKENAGVAASQELEIAGVREEYDEERDFMDSVDYSDRGDYMAAVSSWRRGFCQICGSRADLGLHDRMCFLSRLGRRENSCASGCFAPGPSAVGRRVSGISAARRRTGENTLPPMRPAAADGGVTVRWTVPSAEGRSRIPSG